jgi:pentatricopeptide repeat protein
MDDRERMKAFVTIGNSFNSIRGIRRSFYGEEDSDDVSVVDTQDRASTENIGIEEGTTGEDDSSLLLNGDSSSTAAAPATGAFGHSSFKTKLKLIYDTFHTKTPQLIRKCAEYGLIDEVKENASILSTEDWNIIIPYLIRHSNTNYALEVYKELRDSNLQYAFVKGFCQVSDFSSARLFLQQIVKASEEDSKEDVPRQAERTKEAIGLYIKSLFKATTTIRTDFIEQEIEEFVTEYDATFLRTICTGYASRPGHKTSCLEWLEKYQLFSEDDHDKILLKCHVVNEDLVSAEAVFSRIRKSHPDDFKLQSYTDIESYLDMLKLYCFKSTTIDHIMKATDILAKFNQLLPKSDFKTAHAALLAHSIILHGYIKRGMISNAVQMLNEMYSKSISPSIVTLTSLMYGYCSFGMFDEALELYRSMKSQSIKPDTVLCTVMLNGAARAGDYSVVYEIYKDMNSLQLDSVAYTALIYSYAKHGHSMEECWDIYNEMKKRNMPITIATYNALLTGCVRNGDFDTAQKVLQEAREVKPNSSTYVMLMGLSAQEGRTDKVLNFFNLLITGTERIESNALKYTLNLLKSSNVSVNVLEKVFNVMEEKYRSESEKLPSDLWVHYVKILSSTDEQKAREAVIDMAGTDVKLTEKQVWDIVDCFEGDVRDEVLKLMEQSGMKSKYSDIVKEFMNQPDYINNLEKANSSSCGSNSSKEKNDSKLLNNSE